MQPKITYSNPIYHFLSKPQKLKIQACQNIPIHKFILSNVPHNQHPNSEYMHIKMHLKVLRKWHGSVVEIFIKGLNSRDRISLIPDINIIQT